MGLLWRTSPVSKARKCIGATDPVSGSAARQRTGKISPTAYFSDPLGCRDQRHHTDQLGSNWTYTLIGGTWLIAFITNHHHDHQLLIVAIIKLKQITIAIRNDLAMSVVIENCQLVVIQLDLTPIGD